MHLMEKFTATPSPRLRRGLLLLELLSLAVAAVLTWRYFAMPDAARIVAAMAVGYAVPRAVLSRSRHCSTGSLVLLYVVGAGLMAFAVYNMWSWTVHAGRPLDAPHILSDGGKYYKCALHYYDGSVPPQRNVHYYGLPAMIYLTWKLLGVSLVWPMAVNYMLTLLSMVVFGFMACRLLAGRLESGGRQVMLLAMLLMALSTYMLSQGALLQKEALNYMGMAMVGYVLSGLARSETLHGAKLWRETLVFFLGAGMLISTRGTMAYFVAAGIVLAVAHDWRRNWRRGGALLLITLVLFVLGTEVFAREAYFYHQVRTLVNTTRSADRMSEMYIVGPSQQPLRAVLGDYFYHPLWLKVLLTPVTATALYLVPFPWLRGDYSVLNILSRTTCTWYAVGGLSLFYFLFMSWRRSRSLGWLALWPVACFLAVAYATGGSVARYTLPLQPLFVVIAVYVLCQWRDKKMRHALCTFAAVYALVLAVTLCVCHYVQMQYM